MDLERIKEIGKKMEYLKQKKAKSEGVMEDIVKRWKSEFQCASKEEVEVRIEELKEEVVRGEKRLKVLMGKIEKAYDWDSVERDNL